jgi:hypothetical protein
LRFIYTSWLGTAGNGTASQVFQGVDLRALHDSISEGYMVARIQARYNRVPGDAQTDTAFITSIYAFAGDPNTLATQIIEGTPLAWQRQIITTDADPNTWELGTVEVTLPTNTDFIAIMVAASENIYNDLTGIELDGHYCDAVTLEVVPPYMLTLDVVNGTWGSVQVDPNLAFYEPNVTVTLTARPIEGKAFKQWEIYHDPNLAGDANHAVIDSNSVTSIVMDGDKHVTAVFKCGSGVEGPLPLLGYGLLTLGIISRRVRRRRRTET